MKFIINADDFGLSPGVNEAILELSKLGTVTSTTVMTNMPYYKEVSQLLPNHNFSIGLHFNLTQGKPVSPPEKVKSLLEKDGNFFPVTTFVNRLRKKKIDINDIYNELSAQYSRLFAIIGERLTHIDSHQGVHKYQVVNNAIRNFAKHNKVPAIRNLKHYYITNHKEKATVERPSINLIHKYGLKRIAVEIYLYFLEKKNNHTFKQTKGVLTTQSKNTLCSLIDLRKFSKENTLKQNVYEVICHPAAHLNKLENTKLLQQRIVEYNFLKSEESELLKDHLSFVSYSALIEK